MTRKSLFAIHAFGGMTANERRLGRFLRDGAGHPDPAPAPATPEDPDAAFDAAFETHANEAPTPVETGADAGGRDGGMDPGAAPAGGEPAAAAPDPADPAPAPTAPADAGGAPVPAGQEPPAPAPATPPSPAPAAPAPNADDVLNRLAGLINSQPATPETPDEPAPQEPLYNAEEQGLLAEYEKNWPDVAKAETLRRRGEYHDLMKYIFGQVHAYVAPLQEQLRTVGNTLHLTELKASVPDYTPLVEEEVNNWIATQPDYLQEGMARVMQSGTSEQVADLIGRYRAATGVAPQAPPASAPATAAAPAATPPAAAPKTELSSAAIQAAESLAPVSGERSAVPQGEPEDFDSAFAKYAATMPDI